MRVYLVNDDSNGLLSPNSFGKMPVKPKSLIHVPIGDLFPAFSSRVQFCVHSLRCRFAVLNYLTYLFVSLFRVDGKGGVKFDVIFGPAYKGIPLGAVVSSALYSEFGVNVGFTYNRKEAKDHGEGGLLVGDSMDGKSVLVVDDVITAGTAIRESYDMIKQANAEPIGVIIALDRAEIRSLDDRISAVDAVKRDLSINVVSIVNLRELQLFLEHSPDYDQQTLQSVVEYRNKYGAV
jgi:orotate phosphoribosyltransferase